jgi:ribonuclease J
MRACIHRGTQEIGGSCIELESQGYRLVLDVGMPLQASDPDQLQVPPVLGFKFPENSLLGVFITHAHLDHYGLASELPKDTPFFIGEAAHRILRASSLFGPDRYGVQNPSFLKDRVEIPLGPFKVTPFLVDHSAYDAYAILVEADGKGVFYTGDFRVHGWKAAMTRRLIANPPKSISTLLMEGTNLGRPETETCLSEKDLVEPLAELINGTEGMALVWASAQNIDRLATLWKACRKAKRQLITDLYTAEVLAATGNPNVPQSTWSNLRVYLPSGQRAQIIANQAFEVVARHKLARIYPEDLAKAAPGSAMLFRPSMRADLERAGCLEKARLICSIWSGYLKDPKQVKFLDWLERHRITIRHCHTSGHATSRDLLRLRRAMPEAQLVPVHLDPTHPFPPAFAPISAKRDGEWWEIR